MSKTKLDLVKEFKPYYTAKTTPQIVEFGEIPYLTIEGKGDPAKEDFTKSPQALYTAAYGIKNIYKKRGKDFGVPKMEGLWWVKSKKPPLKVPRDQWYWKLLVRMPDFVASEVVKTVQEEAIKKKKLELVKKIKLEKINEGKCIQIMHLGSYSTEPKTIDKMKNFAEEKGLIKRGFHHEIYLSDPRRTAPEKMKTILRQPVK